MLQILKHTASSGTSNTTAAGDTGSQLFPIGDEYTSGATTGGKVPPFKKAPQLERPGYDQKVDIWAVGCLLFELLSGGSRCPSLAWHSSADCLSSYHPHHVMSHNTVTLHGNALSRLMRSTCMKCKSVCRQASLQYAGKYDCSMHASITTVKPMSAGKGPFEVANKDLTCALILWGDIQHFPDKLSQPCISFIQVSHVLNHGAFFFALACLCKAQDCHLFSTQQLDCLLLHFAAVGLCPTIPITTTTPPMVVLSGMSSVLLHATGFAITVPPILQVFRKRPADMSLQPDVRCIYNGHSISGNPYQVLSPDTSVGD